MKKATHTHKIEVKLREVSQLFNSMDPSPFNEKDLDRNAEDFIVSWAQEYPLSENVSLRIHLDQMPIDESDKSVQEAVHHYFKYRSDLTHLELRRLFKQGRTSLFIGLSFLAVCILLVNVFLTHKDSSEVWVSILRESLTIAGWVAMWKPMQMYLYDWWPLQKREKVFIKLSKMTVEIVPSKKARTSTNTPPSQ